MVDVVDQHQTKEVKPILEQHKQVQVVVDKLLNLKAPLKSLQIREAFIASGVMTFAGIGDAILYPILPIYGEQMGFSVFLIGLLLSVNRFVRILANTTIANVIYDFGMKKVLIFSSILAVLTTVIYGLEIGFFSFLIARILWGISYSGLKISTLNYAAQAKKASGFAFGMVKSIKSIGGIAVLGFGPLLITEYGLKTGLLIIASISSVGIFLGLLLSSNSDSSHRKKVNSKKSLALTPINLLVFILAFLIDGVLVVSLAQIIGEIIITENEILVAVAFYLFLKKSFTLIFSLISGIVSLKIKPMDMYKFSVLMIIIGLVFITFKLIALGIVMTFLFNTVIVTLSPLIAIEKQNKDEKNTLQAISGVSTWWDLGAALGAFSGIYLFDVLGGNILFGTSIILLVILIFKLNLQHGKTNRTTL